MKIVQLSAAFVAAGLFIAGPVMAQTTTPSKPTQVQPAAQKQNTAGGGGGGTDNPGGYSGAMKQQTSGGGGGGTDNPGGSGAMKQ